ncbi:unnamed protein product [Closterium sp. NIES-65]|nr:unnamed protein product [Closterium sp. NIES-65]
MVYCPCPKACMGRAAGGGRVHMGMEREDKVVFTVPGVPSPIYPIFCVAHCRETLVGGGGRVHMGMEGEDKVVYEEQPGEVVTAMTHAPFLYNITHCSPPIHGQVISYRIYQWMDLHIRMGVDHFSLNDVGGVDPQLRTLIAPLLDEGIVEITDFRDLLNYEVWYDGQVMMVNDCVYRFRHLSKWIMYLDFDEFMFINAIPRLSARIHRLTHAQSCFPLLVSPFSCPPSHVPLSPLMHPSFMWLFGNTTPLSAHTLPSSCPEFIPPSHVPLSPLTTFLLRDVALPGAHAHASLSAFTTSSCLARAFPMRACPLRPYEGNTFVNHFLMPYEGMPYVTHGSLWWDLDRCLPSQGPDDPRWPLERMLWHGPGIYCKAKDNNTNPTVCLHHYGHRKLFVDPRRVGLPSF